MVGVLVLVEAVATQVGAREGELLTATLACDNGLLSRVCVRHPTSCIAGERMWARRDNI